MHILQHYPLTNMSRWTIEKNIHILTGQQLIVASKTSGKNYIDFAKPMPKNKILKSAIFGATTKNPHLFFQLYITLLQFNLRSQSSIQKRIILHNVWLRSANNLWQNLPELIYFMCTLVKAVGSGIEIFVRVVQLEKLICKVLTFSLLFVNIIGLKICFVFISGRFIKNYVPKFFCYIQVLLFYFVRATESKKRWK